MTDTPGDTIRMEPIVKVGNAVIGVGAGGTIVLGIWLAFSYGGYDIWDGGSSPRSCSGLAAGAIGQRTGPSTRQG